MKKNIRVALISAPNAPDWGSAITISKNLRAAYQKSFGRYQQHFDFSSCDNGQKVQRVLAKIVAYRPDRIVFISRVPHPTLILQQLVQSQSKIKLPPIDIHVFGDLTLSLAEAQESYDFHLPD